MNSKTNKMTYPNLLSKGTFTVKQQNGPRTIPKEHNGTHPMSHTHTQNVSLQGY